MSTHVSRQQYIAACFVMVIYFFTDFWICGTYMSIQRHQSTFKHLLLLKKKKKYSAIFCVPVSRMRFKASERCLWSCSTPLLCSSSGRAAYHRGPWCSFSYFLAPCSILGFCSLLFSQSAHLWFLYCYSQDIDFEREEEDLMWKIVFIYVLLHKAE